MRAEFTRLPTFENISFNQRRDDRSDRELEVPFLAEGVGTNRHVLRLNRKLHGERTDHDYLADRQADREGYLVGVARVPIDKHVRRRAYAPTIARQIGEEVLKIHLAQGLRAIAADREPLLGKYSRQPLITQVPEYAGWSQLPFVLP